MSFFPLDREILTSTIWVDGSANDLKVWLYLLLRANRQTGIVPDADPAIAMHCGLELDQVASSLAKLGAPDEYSRTGTKEGRRIERVHGRVRIVNHSKYMNKDYSTPRTQAWRERQRERGNSSRNDETVPSVTGTTDTDTDKKKEKKRSPPAPSSYKNNKGNPRSARGRPANPYPFTIFWDHKEQRIKVEEVDLIVEHFTSWAQSNNRSGLNIREILRRAQPSFERHAIQQGYFKVSPNRLTLLFAKWVEKDILDQNGRKQYAEDPFEQALQKAEEEES